MRNVNSVYCVSRRVDTNSLRPVVSTPNVDELMTGVPLDETAKRAAKSWTGVVATCRVEAQRANLPPLSDQCSGTRVDRARPSGSARCTRGALRSAALLPPGLAEQVR